jgi:hypothetical protein
VDIFYPSAEAVFSKEGVFQQPRDVERGERNLSLLKILKLAAALRVHPSKLFVKF